MPGARAKEAARLVSLFLGAPLRRRDGLGGPALVRAFAVDSRNEKMTEMMTTAVDAAACERGAWPLAGRALKFVYDSLGHQAGDELIRSVARTLAGRPRPPVEV